jgi:uncharacterized protein YjdB
MLACDDATGPEGPARGVPGGGGPQFAVNPATIEIGVGETVQLRARLNGEALDAGALEWYSSDPERVLVSADGLAEGLAIGSVAIIAEHGGLSATSTVTVVSRNRGWDDEEEEPEIER